MAEQKRKHLLKDINITRVGICAVPAVPEAEFVLMKSKSNHRLVELLRALVRKAAPEQSQEKNMDIKTLTVEQLKAENPELYKSIVESVQKKLGNESPPEPGCADKEIEAGQGKNPKKTSAAKEADKAVDQIIPTIQKAVEELLEKKVAELEAKLKETGNKEAVDKAGPAPSSQSPPVVSQPPTTPQPTPAPAPNAPKQEESLEQRVADLEMTVASLVLEIADLKANKQKPAAEEKPPQPTPPAPAPSQQQPFGVVGKSRQVERVGTPKSVFGSLLGM